MPVKRFLDTNVLIYACSSDEPVKKGVAEEVLGQKHLFVTVVVLNEFSNVLRTKFHRASDEIDRAIGELTEYVNILDVNLKDTRKALQLWNLHRLDHFDAFHLACALRHGCDVFVSEDKKLRENFKHENMRVINPFEAV